VPPPTPSPRSLADDPPPEPERRWFGSYSLITFGGTLALGLGLSFARKPEAGLPIAAAGLLLAGPITHWAVEGVGPGFRVLALNFGAVISGGLTGAAVYCMLNRCRSSRLGDAFGFGGFFGGTAGALIALIVDVAAMSCSPPEPRRLGAFVLPDLRVSAEGTTFGVVGAF